MANRQTFDDASRSPSPGSPLPAGSSIFVSPEGPGPDLDRMGARYNSLEDKFNEIILQPPVQCSHRVCPNSKIASRRSPMQWPLLRPSLQVLSRSSAVSQPVLLQLIQEQLPLLVSLVLLQHLGLHQVLVVAPQPPGPVTQALRMNAGIQGGNSKITQVLMTKMHELPFSHGFLARNATQARTNGFKKRLTRLTFQKESIAKEGLNQLDSCFHLS